MKYSPILTLIALSITLTSCTLGRFVFWNFANIDDYKKFQNEPIANDASMVHSFVSLEEDSFQLPSIRIKDKRYDWEEGLDKTGTVAFLVMRNDTILYEKYLNGYEQYTPVNSFSVAKSYISTLIGMARDEGKIKSLDDSVLDYLPGLPKDLEPITLRNLLEMRSGINFKESYISPFSGVALYYYGRDLDAQYNKLGLKTEPDNSFQYKSANTQLLGEIVEKVYGQPLNELVTEKLWIPLGAEQPASWSVDNKKDGTFKAFCCLNAVARDFARLGLLYLNEGNWYGKQLVSREWVDEATTFDRPKNRFQYTYQWWHQVDYRRYRDRSDLPDMHEVYEYERNGTTRKGIRYPLPDYFAQGHLGQYIYVHPEENIVIVRLGKKYGKTRPGWSRYFEWIAQRNGVSSRQRYTETLSSQDAGN